MKTIICQALRAKKTRFFIFGPHGAHRVFRKSVMFTLRMKFTIDLTYISLALIRTQRKLNIFKKNGQCETKLHLIQAKFCKMNRKIFLIFAVVIAASLSVVQPVQAAKRNWKAVLVSGDDSISNFDRARTSMGRLLSNFGFSAQNIKHLTSDRNKVGGGTRLATADSLFQALRDLQVNPSTDACAIFMTSHGSPNNGGFMLRHTRGEAIYADQFARMVNDTCGQAPAVILISACFSGQFIVPALKGPNRIILTAASRDRSSFGCDPGVQYTFWDECLLGALGRLKNWHAIYQDIRSCVERKERSEGFTGSKASLPQAYFGSGWAQDK
jgi:hypothetical protein